MRNRRSAYLLLSLGLVLGLLALPGCKRTPSEKMAEKMMERALEKASGGKADVDFAGGKVRIQDAQGVGEIDYEAKTWPNDLPEGVLRFEDGKIKGVTRSTHAAEKSWMVMVEDIDVASVNAYVEALKAEGWSIPMNMVAERGGMFQAEKESLYLIGMYNAEEKIISLNFALRNE
ncbi:MAG: hypothetical protein FJY82_10150 [Candidatus Aminicenantes bacterium]|nr:hypothetical protein [Candidatus Aminicenantes bacterium]